MWFFWWNLELFYFSFIRIAAYAIEVKYVAKGI